MEKCHSYDRQKNSSQQASKLLSNHSTPPEMNTELLRKKNGPNQPTIPRKTRLPTTRIASLWQTAPGNHRQSWLKDSYIPCPPLGRGKNEGRD
jgi:hypothetical protein